LNEREIDILRIDTNEVNLTESPDNQKVSRARLFEDSIKQVLIEKCVLQ